MIKIDGAQGEGGGQVLRTALTFSVLTGEPINLFDIRANRRNPGLAPQHLACIRSAGMICNAEIAGAKLRATEVTFTPGGAAQSGDYYLDISQLAGTGSAGAITLLLQAIWLPLALAEGESRLTLRGGTHVNWSPPTHYTEWVLLPMLKRIGVEASLETSTWGWYPKGGGQVEVTIKGGAALQGIDLGQRGELAKVQGFGAVSNLPSHIPQRISGRANNLLKDAGLPASVEAIRHKGPSTGAGLFIALEYEHSVAGFGMIGKRGMPSEDVANEVVADLLNFHRQGAALDRYLPDQLLPVLMLAEGESIFTTSEITRHTLTSINIIQKFIKRDVRVEGEEGQPGKITIIGDRPERLS